jgi:hypothetical protein
MYLYEQVENDNVEILLHTVIDEIVALTDLSHIDDEDDDETTQITVTEYLVEVDEVVDITILVDELEVVELADNEIIERIDYDLTDDEVEVDEALLRDINEVVVDGLVYDEDDEVDEFISEIV